MNDTPLDPHYELPIKLPFLTTGNKMKVRDFINSLLDLIDRNAVPNNRLPVLWSVRLGYVSDPGYNDFEQTEYNFVYSPALMGRKLNLTDSNDLLYIMDTILEQWNTRYEKQYRTDAEMPSTYFVSSWREMCEGWNISSQDLYDAWVAQRVKTRLNTHIDIEFVPSSTKKI
jgi:hypothetical protein